MLNSYLDNYLQRYLAGLTDEQLLALVRVRVFPRLTLAQKQKLLTALQQEVQAGR